MRVDCGLEGTMHLPNLSALEVAYFLEKIVGAVEDGITLQGYLRSKEIKKVSEGKQGIVLKTGSSGSETVVCEIRKEELKKDFGGRNRESVTLDDLLSIQQWVAFSFPMEEDSGFATGKNLLRKFNALSKKVRDAMRDSTDIFRQLAKFNLTTDLLGVEFRVQTGTCCFFWAQYQTVLFRGGDCITENGENLVLQDLVESMEQQPLVKYSKK